MVEVIRDSEQLDAILRGGRELRDLRIEGVDLRGASLDGLRLTRNVSILFAGRCVHP